jgi:zinc transport system substrate-binding protein
MARLGAGVILSAVLLAAAAAAGPEGAATQPASVPATGPTATQAAPVHLRVLCSTYPIYLFTRNVAAGRDNLQIDLLISAALGCPHDYMVTVKDIQTLSKADVLVLNGLGMEASLQKPLKHTRADLKVIDSSAGITDLIPLGGEGHEHGHGHEEQAEGAEGHAQKPPPNPHLFASPRQAAKVVRNIAEGLAKLDPAGAKVYRANAAAYAKRLAKLGDDFAALVATLPNRKIVTEHAVFDYLARDCGLQIVAVIEAEPGQEPSAAQMIELVRTIRSSGVAAVFTEPQYPAKAADTIAREVGVPSAMLDPVASGPSDAPLDYYEKVMAENLKTVKTVLGAKNR